MNIITLTQYKTLSAKIKEMEKKLENLKSEIISELEVNTEKRVGQYTISLKEVSRKDIDKKQLQLDYPEIYGKYETVTTFNRLTVK